MALLLSRSLTCSSIFNFNSLIEFNSPSESPFFLLSSDSSPSAATLLPIVTLISSDKSSCLVRYSSVRLFDCADAS